MLKEKYMSTFSCQTEAIVFIILQIFLQQWDLFKIGNITYSRTPLELAGFYCNYITYHNYSPCCVYVVVKN